MPSSIVAAMQLGAGRGPAAICAAAAAAALGVVGGLAFDAGGYFPTAYLEGGAVALAALGVLLAIQLPRYALSTHALSGLGALSLFAAWTGLSAAWSPTPDAALADLQRDLLYVALFGLGLLAAGSGRHAALVGRVVLAVIALIVGAVALVALGAHRGSLLLTVAVAGVAAALAIVAAPSGSDGGYLGELALLTGAAGAVIAVIAAGRASPNMMRALHAVVRPLLIALAVLAGAVALVGYAVKADAVEGRADRALRSTGHFVSR